MARRDRLERKRRARLATKAQKAGVVDRLPELLRCASWNRRFHLTIKLRFQKASQQQ